MRRIAIGALMVVTVLCTQSARAQVIKGGGESILNGGTGGPSPLPVKTIFAFQIVKDGDKASGTFDCLALKPSAAVGPGSGAFTESIMYVTGRVTAVSNVTKTSASFSGTATVTGLGAGASLPFTCDVDSTGQIASAVRPNGTGVTTGNEGARMTLVISGLTFDEVVTSGEISISPLKKR